MKAIEKKSSTMPLASPEEKVAGSPPVELLFLRELLLPDVRASQLDVQHALHGAKHLLVWCGCAPLEVLDDGDCGVAFGGELLLCHLVALVRSALLDGVCYLQPDGLGLDNVVAAVDFGEMLAFNSAGSSSLSTVNMWRLILNSQNGEKLLTAFPAAYFFSVPTTRPCRWAALSALLPLMTVSRTTGPPRFLEPMRVTESQSLIVAVKRGVRIEVVLLSIGL